MGFRERLRTFFEATSEGPPSTERLDALESRLESLEKKLSMTMGTLQAMTAQLTDLRQDTKEAAQIAHKAQQQANSALATAESAAEGVSELEAPATSKPAPPKAGAPSQVCAVSDCDNPVRAKGLCGRHYQKWRRGNLPGF